MTRITLAAVISVVVLALQGYGQCPDKNGHYPVPGQCDAYIECVDGVGEEKLCPEGLLFNDKVSPFAFPCQYPIDVSCENRAKLQPAQPTDDCPHQFGYYRMGDSSHCGQFMNCASGVGFVFNCPEGLAYDEESYRCDWPDQVKDCDAEAYLGFKCPQVAKSDLLGDEEYRFFKSNAECRKYFVCIAGKPRMLDCGEDRAFNDLINACDGAENVTGCATGKSGINGQCPEENGKFAVPDQCDAYIECTDGVPEEKLCQDGLIFNDKVYQNGTCVFAPIIECGTRTKLQPANATKDCPRQFGFHRVGKEPAECSYYMNCAHGVGLLTKCPEGLAFNKDTYRCDWPDETPDCDTEAFLGFTCPPIKKPAGDDDEPQSTGDNLRHYVYVKPDDCKKYFVCVNGSPRLNSCAKFLAFNQKTQACDFHTHVPHCYNHLQKVIINPEVEAIREQLRSFAPEEALKEEITYDDDE